MKDVKDITNLLKLIELRSGAFFYQKSFYVLMSFIDGYYLCKRHNGLCNENDAQFWGGFNECILNKFNCECKKVPIEQIIIAHFEEAERYDAFFQLFNEFLIKTEISSKPLPL